jgi:long-subunit fatty acid transport protein
MRALSTSLVLLVATAAHATIYDTYGFGPRAASMGGAMTAEAKDYSATFYNPALLVERKDVNFGLSFQWNKLDGQVAKKDNARELDCTYCQAPDSVGYTLGLLFPLGGKVKNRVALGVALYVPSGKLVRVLAPDPNAPFWYHYQSHPERVTIHAGMGIKIFDWWTIGLGVEALADIVGSGASVNVDLFNKTVKSRQIDAHLATRVAPMFGLQIKPKEWLRFGATYRSEMALNYQIPASVDLEGIGVLAFIIQGYTHYTPHIVAVGAAWDITPDFTVSIDGEYMRWSAAPSPYVDLSIDLSGDVLKALGLENALDISSPVQKPGFSDTFNARLGVEYRVSKRVAGRLGGFYRPTPVPKQNVPGTNILDGNAIGLGAGIGFNFDDPLEVFQAPVNIDFAAQAQFLMPRETDKEATDTVPSYTYAAKMFGLTIVVRYDF